MGSVVFGVDGIAARGEIIAIDIVSGLVRVVPHIVLEVFVVVVDAPIYNSYDYVPAVLHIVGVVFPHRNDIDVAAADRG